jgi:surface protein
MFIASGCPNPIDPNHAATVDRLTFCTTCTDYFNFTSAPTASPLLNDPIIPMNGSFLPITNQVELFQAIDDYIMNGRASDVVQKYGYPIGSWDVSQVTDFSYAFANERNSQVIDFNEDIGQWNTSSAVSMSYMFAGAVLFNQDISSWSTGKVINMTGMCKYIVLSLHRIKPYNPLLAWSDGMDFSIIFFLVMGADLFNGDLSMWDTNSVIDMSTMFQSALTFKGIGLSNWDTSSVTTLLATFEEAGSFVGNISMWDTSNVIDMQRTFQYASSFNGDISQWNVSNVLSFSYAFSGASSFNRDLSSWDVSAAYSMIGMVRFWLSNVSMRQKE